MTTERADRIIPNPKKGTVRNLLLNFLLVIILLCAAQSILKSEPSQRMARLGEFFNIPFLLLLVSIPFAGTLYSFRKRVKEWHLFGASHGFQTEGGERLTPPDISGTYRGHQVCIKEIMEDARLNDENTLWFMEMTIHLAPPVESSLTIKNRRKFDFMRALTGDTITDQKLITKTSSPEMLNRLLADEHIRQGLIEIGERAPAKALTIEKDTLLYRERGIVSDIIYMQAVLDFLIEVANKIQKIQ